ncbi:ABC transporter permease [Hathewaya histolytica]|uniref:Putative oligopeptide ABC transporter permease n=1 Tax=Hathewaya histolytica TaxID=1498 RepID=A0A4U9R5F9_HATHI|nr:ABC transporter permease [Hathewaya histolytica]VTQ85741.1 putative oligopeptide ABC transporter permease [Hathewaya histolytica]
MKNKILLKRILNIIPMLFFISFISFILMNLAPGDPVQAFITPDMDYNEILRIKHNMGLDKPIVVRYFIWLFNILKGDLGYSMITHQKVSVELGARIIPTLILMGSASIFSLIISIPLGMYVAIHRNKLADNLFTFISYIGISIPGFWFGMILITIFSLKLRLLPSIGMHTIGVENSIIDLIKHMIMPCLVLSLPSIAENTRYVRSSILSQLEEDYVQTALAKGASRKRILTKHVLKNSLLPLVTILCMSLPDLFTGAFITETIFGWPGMGRLGISSIQSLDYPIIMAITMLSSTLLIFGNLIADLLYTVIDPRIRRVNETNE